MQDNCAKWEWRAGVRCRVTSRSALKEGATQWGQQLRLRLPTSSAARKAFFKRRLLEGAAVHVVQLCLVVKHCHPINFPHVNERLARDLSRVPNFHAARYGTRLRLAGMQPAARMKGTGVQAFLQAGRRPLKAQLRLAHWDIGTLGPWGSPASASQMRQCRVLSRLLVAATRASDEDGEAVRCTGCTFKHLAEAPAPTRAFIGEGVLVGAPWVRRPSSRSPLSRPIFAPSDDPPGATGCPSHAAAVSCV